MQQKRCQSYSPGLKLLPQCSCQPTRSSCCSILDSICAGEAALRLVFAGTPAAGGLVALPEPSWQGPPSQRKEGTAFFYKGSSSASQGVTYLPLVPAGIWKGACCLGSSVTLSRSDRQARLSLCYTALEWKRRRDATRQSSGLLNFPRNSLTNAALLCIFFFKVIKQNLAQNPFFLCSFSFFEKRAINYKIYVCFFLKHAISFYFQGIFFCCCSVKKNCSYYIFAQVLMLSLNY